MIDEALNQIEDTEPHQNAGGEKLSRPADVVPPRVAPKNIEASGGEQIRAHVEDAVPEHVDLQIADAVGGITRARQHVVPLEHLMEQDAVEEASEPQSEQDTCGYGKSFRF